MGVQARRIRLLCCAFNVSLFAVVVGVYLSRGEALLATAGVVFGALGSLFCLLALPRLMPSPVRFRINPDGIELDLGYPFYHVNERLAWKGLKYWVGLCGSNEVFLSIYREGTLNGWRSLRIRKVTFDSISPILEREGRYEGSRSQQRGPRRPQ